MNKTAHPAGLPGPDLGRYCSNHRAVNYWPFYCIRHGMPEEWNGGMMECWSGGSCPSLRFTSGPRGRDRNNMSLARHMKSAENISLTEPTEGTESVFFVQCREKAALDKTAHPAGRPGPDLEAVVFAIITAKCQSFSPIQRRVMGYLVPTALNLFPIRLHERPTGPRSNDSNDSNNSNNYPPCSLLYALCSVLPADRRPPNQEPGYQLFVIS